MRRSPPRPSSNISTTSRIRIIRASASPGRSRLKACRRTGPSPSIGDELLDAAEGKRAAPERDEDDFAQMILENLKTAGVQQAHKEDNITFTS